MNWLDALLIVIGGVFIVLGIVALVWCAIDGEVGSGVIILVIAIGCAFLTSVAPFIIVDKSSGVTIGEITSVDKNFFGTTAIYLKVNEATQEKGCIEDKELAKLATELIGKKVKVSYGTRVGLYSTGKCNYAPINTITIIE